jgi:hypothetical protein
MGVCLALAAVAAVLAGCSSGSMASSNTKVTAASLPVRRCASGVSGALQHDWKSSSVHVGSVWLYLWGAVHDGGHTGLLPASRFAVASRSESHGQKMMVIVPAGHPVVVRVAPASLPRLRLDFQLPAPDPSRLASGQAADRFVPCSVGRTYFNGGLLVGGAQCAQLELSGATQTPVRLVVALGRSHCA